MKIAGWLITSSTLGSTRLRIDAGEYGHMYKGLQARYIVVSRSQTTIFAQGRYRFQYRRGAFSRGALILKAITPLCENSGLAMRDYVISLVCQELRCSAQGTRR